MLRPQCLRRVGAFSPNPQPPVAGGFTSRPPLASGSWGLRPQIPETAPPLRISGYAPGFEPFEQIHVKIILDIQCSKSSAVATGGPCPPNDCLCPPFSVWPKYFFGASRNDKSTNNNGKRNNNVQR